jgi:hypothetical protein
LARGIVGKIFERTSAADNYTKMQTNHPAMPQSLDRRKFLLGAGTLGLGAAVLPAGRLFAAKSGTRKVRHACIGIGGMGRADFSQFVRHPSVEIVAVCDIDVSRSQAVRAKVPGG